MAGNGQLLCSGGTWIPQGSSKPSWSHSPDRRILATVRVLSQEGEDSVCPTWESQCRTGRRWQSLGCRGGNTGVNTPDLREKKGHGIFNDHKWLRVFCLISLPRSNYAHFSWGAFYSHADGVDSTVSSLKHIQTWSVQVQRTTRDMFDLHNFPLQTSKLKPWRNFPEFVQSNIHHLIQYLPAKRMPIIKRQSWLGINRQPGVRSWREIHLINVELFLG